ncbi:MAG: hypothetical protein JSU07_00325, partial [Bacteroidetes bacterium]|nr:hypothetical protein [Bacteroidota bacterium]
MKTTIVSFLMIAFIAINGNIKAQPGAALNFDGVDDYAKINKATMGAFSIEFWMRTLQTGPTGTQWYHGNGIVDAEVSGVANDFGVTLIGNQIAFGTGNPDVTIFSTSNVNTGNWVHVCAMFTSNPSGKMWLYINGVLEAQKLTGVSSNARSATSNVNFGRIQTGINYYNGDLDEVRVWNKVLTSCEIISTMNCEMTPPNSNLWNYYQFNQGTAAGNNTGMTTVPNVMGGNNATLYNMALTGSSSNFIANGGVVSGISCPSNFINVQGNSNDVPNGSVSTSTVNNTNFNTLCSSNTPLTNTFSIQNNLLSTLSVGGFSITGTNASLFSVSTLPSNTIASTTSSSFAVTFTPTTGGSKSAVVSFTTDNCNAPTYSFAIGATVIGSPVISVNSGSICSGNSFTINPSGASTYTIQGGSSVVSPTANATYTVNGTSATGCISSNTAISSVTVNALPTISVNSGAICYGKSFTINPSGASTYTIQGGSAVVSPTANATYTVNGTSAAGCISSNTATSAVTVNTLPIVSVNNGTICSGNSFTISPSGANTYTIQGGSAVVSPTANASYTVNGTSTAGCLSSNTATSSVNVNALPVVSVNNGTICSGNSFTINPSGANTYTIQGGSAVVSPTANATYSVVGTSSVTGCISNAVNDSVTVNALPSVSLSAAQTTACLGASSIALTGSPAGGVYTGSNVSAGAFTPGTT